MPVDTSERGQIAQWDRSALEARIVRFGDLVPCRNAFIDTRTPGSDAKENFTIIGPGVAENPDQHVHISEAHGFNIGGARQPPNCTNSQHSHDTAEVFVVHSGRWKFTFGEHGDDAQVHAGPGDIVSFPIHAFRGFENIGDDSGFLWSVLGGDDPGRVLWSPQVFDMAAEYGLVLLETGALVDTTAGQAVPADVAPMPVTSRAMIDRLRRMRPEDEPEVIARAPATAVSGETLVIGPGGQLPPSEGFTVSRRWMEADEANAAVSHRPEVVFVQRGSADVTIGEVTLSLRTGDTMTVPRGVGRCYRARGGATELIIVRGTD